VPRVARSLLSDGTLHAWSRGAGPIAIFVDDVDRLAFLNLVHQVEDRFRWLIHAYCLMTTHYHVVVEAKRTALSDGMHRLNGRYALRFNTRHGRTGHLFQSRFGAKAVEGQDQLDAARAYVVENPVRAGMCEAPDEWPWTYLRPDD
jgi:putative transposase